MAPGLLKSNLTNSSGQCEKLGKLFSWNHIRHKVKQACGAITPMLDNLKSTDLEDYVIEDIFGKEFNQACHCKPPTNYPTHVIYMLLLDYVCK